MSTFSGRGLHGQVVNELGTRIMRGDLEPGDTIDPDALMDAFNVSRTVMREVLKVLAAKGLVDARPRLGTFVTDRSRWQLLDTDVMKWRSRGTPEPRLVVELDQVRQIIEPAASRMAAERRTDEQLADIRTALEALEASYDRENETEHAAADIDFHSAILAASGNELLERFVVVLEPALEARDALAYRHATSRDFLTGHRVVYDAIEARDAELAQSRMRSLIEQSVTDIAAILRAE